MESFLTLADWNILYKPGYGLRKTMAILFGFIKRFGLLFSAHQFDFIFIHREATPVGPPWFEWIVSKIFRKKVIYDFDDAIWLPNTSEENRLVSRIKWHSKVSMICKWSYAISCGNEHLCTYAKKFNNRVILNPTTIDTEKHHNPSLYFQQRKSDRVTIGWTGSHSTLQYIDSIIPVMQSLGKKYSHKIIFTVIADKDPGLNLSSHQFIKWEKASEIKDLMQFDIGIMPLRDDIWAKGKCGFKALQYMALGIPAVVSPVGVNTLIVANAVNGFHATTPDEWIQALDTLIQDAGLRLRMGEAGRKKVIDQYSVTSNTSTFLSLFL